MEETEELLDRFDDVCDEHMQVMGDDPNKVLNDDMTLDQKIKKLIDVMQNDKD
ncbi:hypothetical protein [Staphylococcus caprae]|uniref:hypothetical protein n=1 Tax=Staphylococcus caprae TaxID=29380 RepID=UPI003B221BE7